MTNASIITVPKTVSTRRCNPRTETNTTFKSKIDWLLESAVVGEKIFIGASISVKTNTRQIDGLPEVLILSYGSRLLMIPLENKEEPYWLRNLLRRRLSYGDDRISISMLEGALSSLLIYGKTGLQVKVIELSKEITLGEGRRTWKYTKSILGDLKNKAIGEVNFLSFDGSEDHSVPAFWERSAQRALASYLVAASTSPSSNSIIDTTLRSKRELDFLSQSAAASFALYLLAPKRSKGDVCAPKLLKDGSLELANNRFNTRIRPNSQQIIHFKPTDENDGRGIIFRASGIVGTKSKLKGKGGSLADLTNLNKWEGEWEVRGKEDKSLAENKALEWMGNSISFDPLTVDPKLNLTNLDF